MLPPADTFTTRAPTLSTPAPPTSTAGATPVGRFVTSVVVEVAAGSQNAFVPPTTPDVKNDPAVGLAPIIAPASITPAAIAHPNRVFMRFSPISNLPTPIFQLLCVTATTRTFLLS